MNEKIYEGEYLDKTEIYEESEVEHFYESLDTLFFQVFCATH